MRITREALATHDKRAREAGYPVGWRQSDQQIEDSWRSFLSSRVKSDDLWVFGYGSLMWDPGFHYMDVRLADLEGYQRRFTFKIEVGTGSPEHPGLALSLEQQPGRCSGLAFQIAADLVEAESELLWRREMLLFSYSPTIVPVATPQGSITAVAFVSNKLHPKYVGEIPLGETASIIAHGFGPRGASRSYIDKLATGLKTLDLKDLYIEQLLEQINTISPIQA